MATASLTVNRPSPSPLHDLHAESHDRDHNSHNHSRDRSAPTPTSPRSHTQAHTQGLPSTVVRRTPTSPALPPPHSLPPPTASPIPHSSHHHSAWHGEVNLPHSAPAYTSSFPISSIHKHVQIKLENSPTGWSEPHSASSQHRDLQYQFPYRNDDWSHPAQAQAQSQAHRQAQLQAQHQPQVQQHHLQAQQHPQDQKVSSAYQSYATYHTQAPQYTYWQTPYPNMPVQQQQQQQQQQPDGEKRRETELMKARRHVCPVCDKRFNRPSSLNTHMSVHTGAKPYQCLREGCGRRFSVSSNLRRHERTHDARTRPTKSLPARPLATPTSQFPGYYNNAAGSNYYMQPQFEYTMPSSGLRDYAVINPGVQTNTGTSSATGMGMGIHASVSTGRRESAPGYYQTTPAPSPTPPQIFQHKSMST